MSVQASINSWGIALLREHGYDVPDDATIRLDESSPSSYYCETCGPDPYTTTVTSSDGDSTTYYGSLGDVIQAILYQEAKDNE